MSLRAVEFFCGIGGFAAAAGERIEIAAALDINERALAVYRRNFPHPATARTIESIPADELRGLAADLWWLSPPCQPYTRRGNRRDVDDARAAPLLVLMERISEIRPRYVTLENVPEFAVNHTHASSDSRVKPDNNTRRALVDCHNCKPSMISIGQKT